MSTQTATCRIRIDKVLFSNEDGFFVAKCAIQETNPKKKSEYKDSRLKIIVKGTILGLKMNDVFVVTLEKLPPSKWGDQYGVVSYDRDLSWSVKELKRYLKSIPGIGEKSASLLMEAHGTGVIDAIKNSASAFDNINISTKRVEKIRTEFLIHDCFDEVLAYLGATGLDHRKAVGLVKRYQDSAILMLKSEPYQLFLDGAISFADADKIAMLNGILPDDIRRVAMVILATLKLMSVSNGDVCCEHNLLVSDRIPAFAKYMKLVNKESFDNTNIINAGITKLISSNQITADNSIGASPVYYLKSSYACESKVATEIKRIGSGMKSTFFYEDEVDKFIEEYQAYSSQLSPMQQDAVRSALLSPISILTGGPGTGKTKTIQAVIAGIKKLSAFTSIKMCAPTGKAAIKMKEVTGLPATTIHKLLGLSDNDFGRKIESLETDFIIIDEFSMVDIFLAKSLFEKVPTETRVLIIGDYDQLPSVGAGDVLKSLIHSEVIRTTRLTQVFRQGNGSSITSNARRIIDCNNPEDLQLELSGTHTNTSDFYFIQTNSSEETQRIISRSIHKMISSYNYSIDDIQILSPLRNGELGIHTLNKITRDEFNSSGIEYSYGDKIFRESDKVIHEVNNADLGVMNGETGVVDKIMSSEHILDISFSKDKTIRYECEDLEDLDLAYAITIHKSQGSEFPVVIIPVDEQAIHMINKNLLFTAITRASQKVILIGDMSVLSKRAAINAPPRQTFLKDRLQKEFRSLTTI